MRFKICFIAYQYDSALKNKSRNLRKNQTDAESLLWFHLRNKQLMGYKFRRQYPIINYIIDFYCFERKLGIELDGSQHIGNRYDELRSKKLSDEGIRLLRFWDYEVLTNISGVLDVISDYMLQGITSPNLSSKERK